MINSLNTITTIGFRLNNFSNQTAYKIFRIRTLRKCQNYDKTLGRNTFLEF